MAVFQQDDLLVSGRQLGDAPVQGPLPGAGGDAQRLVLVQGLLVFPALPLPEDVNGLVFGDNVEKSLELGGIHFGQDLHVPGDAQKGVMYGVLRVLIAPQDPLDGLEHKTAVPVVEFLEFDFFLRGLYGAEIDHQHRRHLHSAFSRESAP